MARILAFRPLSRGRPERREGTGATHATAQIIIFPGVRYERRTECKPAEVLSQSGKPKARRQRKQAARSQAV